MAGRSDDGFESEGPVVLGQGDIETNDTGRGAAELRGADRIPLAGEEYAADKRFELEEEERLPWLETADYDDDASSSDTGKLIGVILVAALLLALLLAALWWLSNRGPDPELVADGRTIAAPEGDYKERPADPGGRTFEGSGDVAPVVGEGQTREGRLAEAMDDADTEAGTTPDESGGDAPRSATGTAATSGGVGVQIAAYSTRESAERGWSQLTRQTEALSGYNYRIVQGEADIGTVFRLQAVTGDVGAANALCAKLKADGLACQVKR